MEVYATLKEAQMSPQKVRLIAKAIRGNSVEKALRFLNFTPKKAAKLMKKVLHSAIANAENNNGMDVDLLTIHRVLVDEAPVLRRLSPRAKGRANRIVKRRSHIKIVLSDATSKGGA